MLMINGREVKIITTTEFFSLGIEEDIMEMFDGVRLTQAEEWSLEKIDSWRKRGKEVLFHSGHGIALAMQDKQGRPFAHTQRLKKELAYIEAAGIKEASFALGFSCSEVEKTEYGYVLPKVGAEVYDFDRFLEQIKLNISEIVSLLPRGVTLAVEALDYTPGGAYQCCEAWMINRAIKSLEKYGVHLLLDFSHAEVSACRLKGKFFDNGWKKWQKNDLDINELTSEYLRELHRDQITWVHLDRADYLWSKELELVMFDAHGRPGSFEMGWLKFFPNLRFITFEFPHNILALMKRTLGELHATYA